MIVTIRRYTQTQPDGSPREVFAVPSMAIATPQGRRLIPNPAGTKASLFNTLEEAEEAVRLAGFDFTFEGRQTSTLASANARNVANVADVWQTALPLLLKHLQDREPNVVAQAAFALGAMRAPQAIKALLPLLGHDDAAVRKQVAEAYARLGPEALNALAQAYNEARSQTRPNAPYVRLTVMQACAEMAQGTRVAEAAAGVLTLAVAALDDDSWLVRAQASQVLGLIALTTS